MAKKGPLHLAAREFVTRFPNQRRFGVAATEKLLEAVMAELGCDVAEIHWRIRQWALTRTEITPRHLLKPLPQRAIKEEKPRPEEPFVFVVPPFPDKWRGRASSFYDPWEDELP